MKTYKIYNEEHLDAVFANTLAEVRRLTDATDEQIKQLFYKGIVEFNGLSVIAYAN